MRAFAWLRLGFNVWLLESFLDKLVGGGVTELVVLVKAGLY